MDEQFFPLFICSEKTINRAYIEMSMGIIVYENVS